MSVIGWRILGLISGFAAIRMVCQSGEGVVLVIVLGIVGAVVGGYPVTMFGTAPVTRVNLHSMPVAVVGAIVVLIVYHAMMDLSAI
jgi:uncharacterized membrane protein YeaQ/YmgE (transglycosylase-associated protein family)